MIQLVNSGVNFIEDTHKYFLGDKELRGITGTLISKAFPNTYKDIPESVLRKAAERGSVVHQTFELFNTVFGSDINQWVGERTPELLAFNDMLTTYGLRHVESEYMVTDGENFASAIDGVFADGEDGIYIVDYKTTAKLHYDNVSLQLSIYAKWFERLNPSLKVKRIVCMWFKNGQSKFQPLPRVSDEKIDELIKAYLDEDSDYKYVVDVPEEFSSVEQEYSLLTARIDALKLRQDELKQQMMQMMEKDGKKSIKTDTGSYTFIPASTKKTFDTKLFKDTEPEHYEHYLKETETKAQIRIKLN